MKAPRARLVTAGFVFLSVAELAYFIAIGMMIPGVPLFAAGPLSAGAVGAGFAVGVFSVTALILRPWAGRLSDKWGSGRLLAVGALLFAVVTATHLMVTAFWALLAVRIALGVADALFFVAGVAVLADLAPPDRLGEAISYNSLTLYLGIAVGPALGEQLINISGFRALWTVATTLGVIAVLCALRVPPGRRDNAAEPSPLLVRQLIAPALMFVAGLAGAAGFLAFVALQARDAGMAGAGSVLFVYGALVIVCRLLLARLADRYPAPVMSTAALVLVATGLATISLLQVPVGLYAGAVLLALGITFLTPAFYRSMMAALPSSRHGTAAATFSIAVDLGLGGGPILFGLIAGPASIPAAFAVAAALAFIAAAFTALHHMRITPK